MVSCIFIIVQVMDFKISLTLWAVVLAIFTQIQAVTWPQLLADVGSYPNSDTVPLLTDLNNGVSPDTIGPKGWTGGTTG
jgi:hypothetical protein